MLRSFFYPVVGFAGKLTNHKKIGGIHFLRIYKFGFSFYISKKVAQ